MRLSEGVNCYHNSGSETERGLWWYVAFRYTAVLIALVRQTMVGCTEAQNWHDESSLVMTQVNREQYL